MLKSVFKYIAVLSGFVVLSACASSPESKLVAALVEVERPAGASDAVLLKGFNSSIPIYSKIPGLERKYFTQNDDAFGGVYLWSDKVSADAFYNEAWRKRIETTYGTTAKLTWFEVPLLTGGGAEGLAGPDAVVAIVKVSAPWYAPKGTIRSRMRDAVPLYVDVPGLDYKIFSIADEKKIGGIYLWQDQAAADKFYNEDWKVRIVETYGEEAELIFLKAPVTLINVDNK